MHAPIFVDLADRRHGEVQGLLWRARLSAQPRCQWRPGAALVLGDNLYTMPTVRGIYAACTSKPVADAKTRAARWVCSRCDTRAQVDALVARAVDAGGTASREAKDHGFMDSHGFEDLDGHNWMMHMSGTPPKE